MKSILKPTVLKLVVAAALFIGLTWLWGFVSNMVIMDASFYGLPLTFFSAWGPCQAGKNCSEFNGLNLFLDIMFWYLISAFAVQMLIKRRQ
jgi:hypothetical protein